jgi:hypothetical protein
MRILVEIDMENIIDYSKVVKTIYGNGDIFIGNFVNNNPFFGQLKSKDPEYPGESLYIQ